MLLILGEGRLLPKETWIIWSILTMIAISIIIYHIYCEQQDHCSDEAPTWVSDDAMAPSVPCGLPA